MRLLPLVAAILLTTALVGLAPGADARRDLCIDAPDSDLVDADACLEPDRCRFQSDCCPQPSFWCPETE